MGVKSWRCVFAKVGTTMQGDIPMIKAETTFEKKLYDKTMRTNAKNEAEVIMFDNIVTVYRNSADVWFYVVGSQAENELILVHVLMALLEGVGVAGDTASAFSSDQSFNTMFASA